MRLRRQRCPCCGTRVVEYEPDGRPPRPGARCPECGALERHRELCARLEQLIEPAEGVLHFAPEPCLERILRPRQAAYVTTDLLRADVDVQADITRLPFADAEFDVALVIHVLEHIPDDRAAIAEIYRVLRPGGRALMQHPARPGLTQTLEDPSVTDPAERFRLFGQEDHVRIYVEHDFQARIREAGFIADVIRTPSRRDIHVGTKPS